MNYFQDAKRVEEEVWNCLDVRGKVVLDVGLGNSTRKLLDLGACVIVVENDIRKVLRNNLSIPIILCDFLKLPFRREIADITVFSFVLHEINPKFHLEALFVARKLAPMVMIVEPVPSGNEAYLKFTELWRKAMASIGKYEVYQPPKYWERLVKEAGFNITLKKIIRWNSYVPSELLMNMGEETVKEWEEFGVNGEIIKEFKEFLKEKPKMKWSDIAVIVASRA